MGAIKNIHFFIGQLQIGGIETYLLRVAKELSRSGINIHVWVLKNKKDDELHSSLSQFASVTYVGKFNRISLLHVRKVNLPIDTDFVVAMGQTSLLFAMRACSKLDRPVKLAVGVFSQWEFVSDINIYRNNLTNQMFEKLVPYNVFFCTEGSRNDHAVIYHKCIDSKVSPLLIEIAEADKNFFITRIKAREKTTRIISIGRITPFKTYNYQMPYIVKNLIDDGISVHWDVYGDGIKFNDLNQIINDLGMQDHITLHGTLSYSLMHDKLKESDIFIGAGTSIIEASASGLPAIVALDDFVDPMSPGFFCDRSGIYTSDYKKGESIQKIEDIIRSFIDLDDEAKIKLSEKSNAKAFLYSTAQAVHEYEEIYQNARPIKIEFPLFFVLLDLFSLIKYSAINLCLPIRKSHN